MVTPLKKRVFLSGLGAATVVAALFFFALYLSRSLPSFEQEKSAHHVSDRLILDRNGLVLNEIRVDQKVRRLDWVPLDQVSPMFLDVLLKAEDVRFWYHPGVDPIAFIKSSLSWLRGPSYRGASTISMQVVGFIHRDLKSQRHRTWTEKIRQILEALALETKWSKKQILEAYINRVYFRGELQGLAAASHGLLDKAPYALTLPDSAVLVSLIRAPNAEIAKIKQRACWLMEAVEESKSCPAINEFDLATLEQGYQMRSQMQLAPHVARKLVSDPLLAGSSRIKSTIDREFQNFAQRSLQQHISALKEHNVKDGAVVVLENATGNVLVYVGNIGAQSQSPFVDAAKAPRQAGSTLKPFLYGKAIENKIITPATVLRDEPIGISLGAGVYKPNNFDKGFRDLVSVRTALGSSLNIPAVETLDLLGLAPALETLKAAGISNLREEDYYGPSLALGAADIELIELTNAYRAIANGGLWTPVHYVDSEKANETRRVFTPQTAWIIGNLLSDTEGRADTFGLESILSTQFWSGAKTGTSKDMRDNWCVGFSDRYTVGVWAGNFSGERMWNVSGIHGAAPVWEDVMAYLHRSVLSVAPPMPEGVVEKTVEFEHSGQSRREFFLAGTEPPTSRIKAEAEVRSHIVYPPPDAFFAVDPNIPRSRHRMFFQVKGPVEHLRYILDGQDVGPVSNFFPWEPVWGHHQLDIRSDLGLLVDSVGFDVRGRRYAHIDPRKIRNTN